ncbi:YdcF family protein [Enterococcus durans]|uniref:YdcF family protein n=1 Tax=Enterococcus durans TaxID=53345 RepID=UPI00207347F0|nr:YdcF family protein [Enterococcus durans]
MDKQAENYQDWNQLLTFLADKSSSQIDEASLVILAGNCLPILAHKAAEIYQKGQVKKIFLVGGIGHATAKLHRNFEKQGIFLDPTLSESEMCFQYLKEKYRLPNEAFLLETASTNSGENARNALAILRQEGELPRQILLMNDPTLQRRTKATFEKVWQTENVKFINYVPFVPQVVAIGEEIQFTQPELDGQWSKEYFYALVLGEMVRLKDDENGYGPNGKGYMNHVEMPETVWSAYRRITAQFDERFVR